MRLHCQYALTTYLVAFVTEGGGAKTIDMKELDKRAKTIVMGSITSTVIG